jgi:hypothetical protein
MSSTNPLKQSSTNTESPHDNGSAGAGFKETDATENQRAHNALAKLCLRNQ